MVFDGKLQMPESRLKLVAAGPQQSQIKVERGMVKPCLEGMFKFLGSLGLIPFGLRVDRLSKM